MTDRRAALNEVHQSMHEEYHGTTGRNDIIRLAQEAGASSLHGGETALFGDAAIERFAALVEQRLHLQHAQALYEQGMKNLARLNYEINQAKRDEREAILGLADSLGWVDVDRIRARGQ